MTEMPAPNEHLIQLRAEVMAQLDHLENTVNPPDYGSALFAMLATLTDHYLIVDQVTNSDPTISWNLRFLNTFVAILRLLET